MDYDHSGYSRDALVDLPDRAWHEIVQAMRKTGSIICKSSHDLKYAMTYKWSLAALPTLPLALPCYDT